MYRIFYNVISYATVPVLVTPLSMSNSASHSSVWEVFRAGIWQFFLCENEQLLRTAFPRVIYAIILHQENSILNLFFFFLFFFYFT